MSTTPITFERNNLEYTLTARNEDELSQSRRSGLSILLLNRGGKPFRKELLLHLSGLGTREILSVEISSNRLNLEDLQKELPQVKLLFIQSKANWGEIINIAVKEALGEFVFILWNDMDIHSKSISSRVFSKIEERQTFCTVPWLYDKEGDIYPSRYIPARGNSSMLKMLPLAPENEDSTSLFPFDYTGIFHRQKFLRCGGFDGTIENPYWQLMDLGFRASMGKEKIVFNSAIKVYYNNFIPELDITINDDYIQFFLKTLALRVTNNRVWLPGRHLIALWLKTPLNLKESIKRFTLIRQWVKNNQSHLLQDAQGIMEHWEEQ